MGDYQLEDVVGAAGIADARYRDCKRTSSPSAHVAAAKRKGWRVALRGTI